MTNFGHFSHCGNPHVGAELQHQPRVSAHRVGKDQRLELEVRWGCSKLRFDNEADAVFLWELLGAALGRTAPIIRTVPVHPSDVSAARGHCHMAGDVGDGPAPDLSGCSTQDTAGAGLPTSEGQQR